VTCVLTIDIALAFSLPNFPNFLHILFIGILFLEFACVIKSLLNRTRQTRKKLRQQNPRAPTEGPAPGTIIQGAPNWEDEDIGERAGREDTGFDLERIGGEEALKPVPPAYGMYRGSVRIGDHDIRFVSPVMSEVQGEGLYKFQKNYTLVCESQEKKSYDACKGRGVLIAFVGRGQD